MRPSYSECRDMAHALRFLAADAVQKANSGHPGMPMGMADVATVLFTRFLKYDASAPDWPDRDRFILSAGHGSMLLYSWLCWTRSPSSRSSVSASLGQLRPDILNTAIFPLPKRQQAPRTRVGQCGWVSAENARRPLWA